MSPIRVHSDTDIGGDLDDACALALLLSPPDAHWLDALTRDATSL